MTLSSSSSTVRVYWTNFGYYADQIFASVPDAVAHAKKVHFDATILVDGAVVGCWNVFGGYRNLR